MLHLAVHWLIVYRPVVNPHLVLHRHKRHQSQHLGEQTDMSVYPGMPQWQQPAAPFPTQATQKERCFFRNSADQKILLLIEQSRMP